MVHEAVEENVRHAANDSRDKRLTKQAGSRRRCHAFNPARACGQKTARELNDAKHQQASEQPHCNATSVRMQVAMDWWIISAQIVQNFDVDQDIRESERREPEMSWAGSFDEKSRPEVKWSEGNRSSSVTT